MQSFFSPRYLDPALIYVLVNVALDFAASSACISSGIYVQNNAHSHNTENVPAIVFLKSDENATLTMQHVGQILCE